MSRRPVHLLIADILESIEKIEKSNISHIQMEMGEPS